MSSESMRSKLLRVGRRYGSSAAIKQANRTLYGLGLHLNALLAFGASRVDAERLAQCRDESLRLGKERDEARLWNMSSTRERHARLRQARSIRRRGHTLLGIAADDLLAHEDEESKNARALVDAAQAKSPSGGDDGFKLKAQLDALSVVFAHPRVREVLEDNNAALYLSQLDETRASMAVVLDELMLQRGTPETTEQINVLDGEIVTLCRRFRAIARLAAQGRGSPAIAAAFELDELDGTKGRKKAEKEAGGEGESAAG